MPSIDFKGFSEYHDRNVCSLTFEQQNDAKEFEMNFNMNYKNHQVEAESSNDSRVVNITYIEGIEQNLIREFVNSIIKMIKKA